MELLRRLGHWWRDFWGCEGLPNAVKRVWGPDLYWPMDVDSHRWGNKIEMRRRLSV